MAKKQLETLIQPHGRPEPDPEEEPEIKTGRAFHLSFDEPIEQESAQEHESTHTPVHKSTKSKKKMKAPRSQGFRIYPHLVDDLKRIALDERRVFYVVLNEAIEEYIARKKQKKASKLKPTT